MNKVNKNQIYNLLIYITTIIFINLVTFISLKLQAQTINGLDSNCVICAQFVPDCAPNEKLILQTCEKCAHCEPIETFLPEIEATSSPESTCQKCFINAQCPKRFVCVNECCIPNPNKLSKKIIFKDLVCKKCTSNKECLKPEQCIKNCCMIMFPIKIKETECVVCTQFVPECGPHEKLVPQSCKKCAHCEPIKVILKKKKIKEENKKSECIKPCASKCCKENEKCITIDQCKGRKKSCRLPLLEYCTSHPPESLHGRLTPQ